VMDRYSLIMQFYVLIFWCLMSAYQICFNWVTLKTS
jgi:hypothetical protein